MSDITFELFETEFDESSVLECKFGQYIVGEKGDKGDKGDQGDEGTLTDDDTALLAAYTAAAANSASNAKTSADSAANSASAAANTAAQAATQTQQAVKDAQAAATSATGSSTQAASSASAAAGSQTAAAASATQAASSSTSASTSANLARDWATKTDGMVNGADYSAKWYAQQSSGSANAAAGSASSAAGSATAAAGSAAAAAGSAQDAANSAATIDTSTFVALDGSRAMTGVLKAPAAMFSMAPSTYRGLYYQSNGVNRWSIGANQAVENGSNAGSDFSIDRYNDAGTWVENPLTISRANGVASLSKRPYFGGYVPWDTANLPNPARCSTTNTLWFDWGANYAGQIGVKVDTTLMGFLITSSNVGNQLCYTAAHLRTGGGVDTTWNWSGQGGQPTWVWGGNDGASMYVYNPANFNVSYANAAGSVGGVTNPAPVTGATFTGPINVIANGDPNGYQGTLGPGYLKLNEWNNGGYIDLARARDQDYRWRIMFNIGDDSLSFYNRGSFSPKFQNDGGARFSNVWLSATGDWISNTFNGKQAVGNYMAGWTGDGYAISWDGGAGNLNFYVNGTFVAYLHQNVSDAALKENVQAIAPDSCALVDQIVFHSFDMTATGQHVEMGVIAQELQAIEDRWVYQPPANEDKQEAPLTYDTTSLLFDALRSIQQLSARVSSLETQLAATRE